MTMLDKLNKHLSESAKINPNTPLLIAVSGGVDSVVLVDLLSKTGFPFAIAHCNFKLRGQESDGDEVFMHDYCGEHGIELYVKTFETQEFALQEGISVEMAARELRYQWFYELLDSLDFLDEFGHSDSSNADGWPLSRVS